MEKEVWFTKLSDRVALIDVKPGEKLHDVKDKDKVYQVSYGIKSVQ